MGRIRKVPTGCKEGFCGMFDEFSALVDQNTF